MLYIHCEKADTVQFRTNNQHPRSGLQHRPSRCSNQTQQTQSICLPLQNLKAIFRLATTVIIVLLAILVPSFELISAIMGAGFCFGICAILPVVFHLKIFSGHIPKRQLVLDWTLIVVSVILGVTGTAWESLPRDCMDLS